MPTSALTLARFQLHPVVLKRYSACPSGRISEEIKPQKSSDMFARFCSKPTTRGPQHSSRRAARAEYICLSDSRGQDADSVSVAANSAVAEMQSESVRNRERPPSSASKRLEKIN
jgi:hypothetical protein